MTMRLWSGSTVFHGLALLAALVVVAGCVAGHGAAPSAPAPSPAPAVPVGEAAPEPWVIELLHRSARPDGVRVDVRAVTEAADRLAMEVTGASDPLAAWRALLEEDGSVCLFVQPKGGALAESVLSRLRLVALQPEAIRVVHEAAEAPAGALWILAPSLTGETLAPQALESTAGGAPYVVFLDVFSPTVGGKPWHADAVIAANDRRAAAFASRRLLESRRDGVLADYGALATRYGLDAATIDWQPLVLH